VKTIEVTIRPDGRTSLETRGFAGEECRQASRFLEDALGRKTAESLTAEFYQSAARRQQRERQ
jgi:hypothetical protein